MNQNRSTRLVSHHNGANKEYTVYLEAKGTGYIVYGMSGAIGATQTRQKKQETPVPFEQAQKIFDKLVHDKKTGDSHYQVEGVAAEAGTEAQKTLADVTPALPTEIGEDQVESYLRNAEFGMQLKKDGRRQLIDYANGVVRGVNRKGEWVSVPGNVEAEVKSYFHGQDRITLDGEGFAASNEAFDLLYLNGRNVQKYTFEERWDWLYTTTHLMASVQPVQLVVGYQAKLDLFNWAKIHLEEGVVFKNLRGVYGDDQQFKFKFLGEGDFLVGDATPGKRSVRLAARTEHGEFTDVGKVTIKADLDMPNPGDILQVKYLYFTGNALFQPRVMFTRPDKSMDEVTPISALRKKAGVE